MSSPRGRGGGSLTDGVNSGDGLVTITYATVGTLIDSVEALDLPSGLENSLLKKLNGAQKNLDHGNTAGACDKLASFIDQVGAQSGKKIDATDAQELIDEADAVRESLGCGP